MGIFGKIKYGGLMDTIRCDEPSYLIWKWHPRDAAIGGNRENAIRWGSSLRVKDGEVAVFVYRKNGQTWQDYIVGPCDAILQTENLPIIANLIGAAYDGGTPFQAEIYFINTAGVVQVPFGVPYFDLYDPRFMDFGVPTAVRGKISFKITDYKGFVKLHRLSTFDIEMFQTQIRDAVCRYVKSVVSNTPSEKNIPVVQIERAIPQINDSVEQDIRKRFEKDFGVTVTAVDISTIELNKKSEGYAQLKRVTQDIAAATAEAKAATDIKEMQDAQRIKTENTQETLRIQREEAQYAQHKQTQDAHFAAFQLEQQAAIGIAGAEALGKMGVHGATEVSANGAMNPTAMAAGMVMGGAIGQNVTSVMNSATLQVQRSVAEVVPPPIPTEVYYVAENGQATGPYDMTVLAQKAQSGTFSRSSLVWKPGMDKWIAAEAAQELQVMFAPQMPPIPPMPNA